MINETKIKVGDIVKIVNIKGDHCVSDMHENIGEITKVIYINRDGNIYVESNAYYWRDYNLKIMEKCIYSNNV